MLTIIKCVSNYLVCRQTPDEKAVNKKTAKKHGLSMSDRDITCRNLLIVTSFMFCAGSTYNLFRMHLTSSFCFYANCLLAPKTFEYSLKNPSLKFFVFVVVFELNFYLERK